MLAQHSNAVGLERASGNLRIACRVDSFGEAKPHQQKLIRCFGERERLIGDQAMALLLDAREPRFRSLFGCGGVPRAGDIEPTMGAGPNAGIFMRAPIDQIVPAFAAGPGVI